MSYEEGDNFAVAYKTKSNLQNSDVNLGEVVQPLSEDTADCAVVAITASSAFTVSPSHSSTVSTDEQSSSNVLIMSAAPEEHSPLRETQSDPFLKPRWMRYADGLCMIITTMVIVAISVTVALIIQIVTGARQVTPHGGIISSNPSCSELGVAMLNSTEASTADVAVFAALCLCVAHPHAASLGGGGFALVHNQRTTKNASHMFNFREESPSAFSNGSVVEAFFTGKSTQQVAKEKTIAIPGLVKGLQELHKQHGKMPWKSIVEKVSKLAADGVKVSPYLAKAIDNLDLNSTTPALRELVTENDNLTKLKEGDTLKQTLLSQTLKEIAKDATSFYSGSAAGSLATNLQEQGSLLTLADLQSYNTTDTYKVLQAKYGDMKILTSTSPTFGPVLQALLKTMSRFRTAFSTDAGRYLQLHRLTEALKYGFSTLSQAGGDSSKVNLTSLFGMEPNETIGEFIASQINDSWSYDIDHYLYGFRPVVVTSQAQEYVSVIGPDNFIVSIALSLGTEFGSQRMAAGFLLNNAMLDFSWSGKTNDTLQLSQSNMIRGGARPLSSLLPTIITPKSSKCGKYFIPGATPGYISVSSLAQFVINMANKESFMNSVDQPRLHQQLDPYPVQLEYLEPDDLETFLKARNHNVTRLDASRSLGQLDVLLWESSKITSVIDRRDSHNQPFVF